MTGSGMAVKRLRVFLDTSALVAGTVSTTGAAREVLRLCEAGVVELFLSRQVLVEADRTFSAKLPGLVSDYRNLICRLEPIMLDDPSKKNVVRAERVIHSKDAPILAAAINGEVDFLVTWNTRHFHQPSVDKAVRFKVVTPGEFLEEFRRWIPES